MPEERQRRRMFKPKVRTGCQTCKVRRVKCDEEKPHCSRCSRAGFECLGYQKESDQSQRPLVPKEPVQNKPWRLIFENESEYQYFTLFSKRTASDLSGFFETGIWERLILQMCQDEPFARHAVIALAALDKSSESMSSSSDEATNLAALHHSYALKQYGKALKLMRQSAPDGEDEYGVRKALVSCLLTTCFECYHGNHEMALKQVETGLKILTQYKDQRTELSEDATSSVVESELLDAFTRLKLLVLKCPVYLPPPQNLIENSTTEVEDQENWEDDQILENMPSVFDSPREARFFMYLLIHRTIRYRTRYGSKVYMAYTREKNKVEGVPKDEDCLGNYPQKDILLHLDALERWKKAFGPMFEKCRAAPVDSSEFQSATLLEINRLSSKIALLALDEHIQAVELGEEAVQMARQILEAGQNHAKLSGEVREPDDTQALFSLEDGLVWSLFLIATHCYNPAIIREAIYLLRKHPRKEGLWDSLMAAAIAEWLLEGENLNMTDGMTSRLVLITSDFIISERKVEIQCSRSVNGTAVLLPPVVLEW